MRNPFSHAPSIVASHRRGEATSPRQDTHGKTGPVSGAAPPDAGTFFDSFEVRVHTPICCERQGARSEAGAQKSTDAIKQGHAYHEVRIN